MTTFNIIFQNIHNPLYYIANFYFGTLHYFTIFFKKRTHNYKYANLQGGLPIFFFLDKTPPFPPPYWDIALLLRAIILSFSRPKVPRCPTIGSFREKLTRNLIILYNITLATIIPKLLSNIGEYRTFYRSSGEKEQNEKKTRHSA